MEQYIRRSKDYMNADNLTVLRAPFGYVFEKGNTYPSPTEFSVDGNVLQLRDRILHERVLLIQSDIPIRSHNEEDQEIIKNIGGNDIQYVLSDSAIILSPTYSMYSVLDGDGMFHGFHVEKEGLLYVAKALFPEYIEGNSFRIPETSRA